MLKFVHSTRISLHKNFWEGVIAIFDQVPKEELGTTFKHCGWFGLCPVYISDVNDVAPLIVERNWIPEWWLDVQEFMQGTYIVLRSMMNWDYEPGFEIMITGDYPRREE